MIDSIQIRSARAFLNWSTSELAERAGMTTNAINRIERGHVNAQRGTIEKLEKIFENAGIEFLPSSGIRKKDNKILTFEGKNFKEELIEDIISSVQKDGNELFIVHGNKSPTIHEINVELLQEHLIKQKKIGIAHKSFVCRQSIEQLPSSASYHLMPDQYLSSSSLYVYSSKLALSTDSYSPKAVVIDSAQIAESIRRMSCFIWDNTQNVSALHTVKAKKKTSNSGKKKDK